MIEASKEIVKKTDGSHLDSNYRTGYFGRLPKEELDLLFGWGSRKSRATQRYYVRVIGELLEESPNKILATLSAQDLIQFFARRDDLKPSSQNVLRATLSSLFSYLNKVDYIDRNPTMAIARLKTVERIYSKVLSFDQIEEMVRREPVVRNQKIIMFLYYSGVRVSELAGLKWENIELMKGGGAKLLIVGKGSKVRTVFLDDKAVKEAVPEIEEGFVFKSRKQAKIGSAQVFRIIRAAATRAGLTGKVSPHWLRHSNATHAIENGAPIHVVQKTLGHENLATTGKYLDLVMRESSSAYLKRQNE